MRIPVVGGHSESVNVELKGPSTVEEIRQVLHQSPGVIVQDNPETNTYPMRTAFSCTASSIIDISIGASTIDENFMRMKTTINGEKFTEPSLKDKRLYF